MFGDEKLVVVFLRLHFKENVIIVFVFGCNSSCAAVAAFCLRSSSFISVDLSVYLSYLTLQQMQFVFCFVLFLLFANSPKAIIKRLKCVALFL